MIQTVELISLLTSLNCMVLFAEEFFISRKLLQRSSSLLPVIGIISALANLLFSAGHLATSTSGLLLLIFLLLWWQKGGPKNGGADQMTGILLLSLFAMRLGGDESALTKGALYFLGIQSGLSYFIAGFVKAVNRSWWNGSAIKNLARIQKYPLPNRLRNWINNSGVAQKATGSLLVFELCFPFAFLNVAWATGFIFLGAIFHLMNAYVLGLNRFFWSWIATYPAIFFCAIDFHR